jgi:hypothetical protein
MKRFDVVMLGAEYRVHCEGDGAACVAKAISGRPLGRLVK